MRNINRISNFLSQSNNASLGKTLSCVQVHCCGYNVHTTRRQSNGSYFHVTKRFHSHLLNNNVHSLFQMPSNNQISQKRLFQTRSVLLGGVTHELKDEKDLQKHFKSNVPIVLRFTANWCGPCKQLAPVLEKSSERFNGETEKIQMLSVDIDTDFGQTLAQHFQVRSIPAVFSIVEKQVVNTFQGAQPKDVIDRFLDEVIELADQKGLYAEVKEIGQEDPEDPWAIASNGEELLTKKEFQKALEQFGKVVQNEDAKNIHPKAMIGMVKAFLGLDKVEEAKQTVENLSPEDYNEPEVKKLRARIEVLSFSGEEEGDLGRASKLVSKEHYQEAVESLFNVLTKDKTNVEAKKLLMQVFEACGEDSEITMNGRRRLATLLF